MNGHDICDDCGRPVEPAKGGGRRRLGKDGRRRCIACQRWRIRPVPPDDLCADCGRIVEPTGHGHRRSPGGDGARRCAACQAERRRRKQRRPGAAVEEPPCADCGGALGPNWPRRHGRDDHLYRCAACQHRREALRNREPSRLAHRRRRARLRAAGEKVT